MAKSTDFARWTLARAHTRAHTRIFRTQTLRLNGKNGIIPPFPGSLIAYDARARQDRLPSHPAAACPEAFMRGLL